MAMREVDLPADAWTDIGAAAGDVVSIQNVGAQHVRVHEGADAPEGAAGWLLSPGESVVISVVDPVRCLSRAQDGLVVVATTVQM